MVAREDLVADETPAGSTSVNLGIALEAYPQWVERLTQPDLKNAFLANCVSSIPFYHSRLNGRAVALDDFPVVGRADHEARREEFISITFDDPRSEQLAIPTNGTFAPSLRVAWDLPSMFDLNHASYLRFSTVLPGLFSAFLPGEPSVFVITDLPTDMRTSIEMPGLNGTILRRLVIGRDEETDAALVEYLRNARIALLHAKPSVLSSLVELDGRQGGDRRIVPTSVVCSGENLYQDDRARIQAWLNCPIIEAYVASEAGLIAFECQGGSGRHVLSDHLTVEVEAPDGTAHSTGSGQLLITNALNWRHAFVRYRIGDRATVATGACACGHNGQTIIDLPGRERETYQLGPTSIPAAQIAAALEAFEHSVRQYQVSYGGDHQLVITWIPAPSTEPNETAEALVDRLRERFPGTNIELCRVAGINKPGGKLRRFL